MKKLLKPESVVIASGGPVVNYWFEFYINKTLCSLCGNSGIIDTRHTAISGAGVNSGRLNWCICPNGQSMRTAADGKLPTIKKANRTRIIF